MRCAEGRERHVARPTRAASATARGAPLTPARSCLMGLFVPLGTFRASWDFSCWAILYMYRLVSSATRGYRFGALQPHEATGSVRFLLLRGVAPVEAYPSPLRVGSVGSRPAFEGAECCEARCCCKAAASGCCCAFLGAMAPLLLIGLSGCLRRSPKFLAARGRALDGMAAEIAGAGGEKNFPVQQSQHAAGCSLVWLAHVRADSPFLPAKGFRGAC